MPDWLSKLLWGGIPLVCCVALRAILDLRLYPYIIKLLSWIPIRGWFREKPPKLSGDWEQQWDSRSAGFQNPTDRHGNARLYQFGRYCYGEFTAKGVRYCMIGRIHNGFLFGDWQASKDELGYFGTFKLRITDSNRMIGKWLGHSKSSLDINFDDWIWTKTE